MGSQLKSSFAGAELVRRYLGHNLGGRSLLGRSLLGRSLLAHNFVSRGSLGLLAFAVVSAGACDTWGPRIYTAQAYDPEASCLTGYAPIGLVEADELGALCEPVCLRLDETLYLSTVCPPYPSDAIVEDPASSADCSLALGLLDAEASCDDEEETPDASADATE